MRIISLIVVLAAAACESETESRLPPVDSFYFPTGVVHHDPGGGVAGTLYVASADFDRRFDFGSVSAVSLSALNVPVPSYLGGPAASEYPEYLDIKDLGITQRQQVLIAPFAGQMAAWTTDDGRVRLFVPSRAEGDALFSVDAEGANLSCVRGDPRDCTRDALSLTKQGEEGDKAGFASGHPRAPQPFAVAVQASARRVLVTHLEQADSPLGSERNEESFLVVMNADDPSVSADSFVSIGPAPASGIALGVRYAYLSGRTFRLGDGTTVVPPAVRLVDLSSPSRPPLASQLEQQFRIFDMRDVVLSADEQRLFIVTRDPDELLVLKISDAQSDLPGLALVGSVPLPEGPNQARLIPRPTGRGSLVAITCSTANAVALYDDETGSLATVISENVGLQPFGLSVQSPGTCTPGPGSPCGARVFVTAFGDGRVSVIDIRDVIAPSDARVIARLGNPQECLADELNPSACPGLLR